MRVFIAIVSLTFGFVLLASGAKSLAQYYPNEYCLNITTACGNYPCYPNTGTCPKGQPFQAFESDTQMGGGCGGQNGPGCTMSSYVCQNKFYPDPACQWSVCCVQGPTLSICP